MQNDATVTDTPKPAQSCASMAELRGAIDALDARLVALLDNLGKGASGAAVQNLNLALGLEETAGL